MNKNDLYNDLNINEDEKNNQNKQNKVIDVFYKPNSSKNKFQERNKYNVLEILEVKLPDKKMKEFLIKLNI